MPRKGENIYKRKDGRWEGRYIKGHRDSKTLYGYTYGKTYKEVKEKLTCAKVQPQPKTKAASTAILPFSAYAKLWLSDKEPTVKYSTYIKHSNLLNGYIIPSLGDTIMDAFNNSVFTTYPYIKSVATTLPFSAIR